MRYADGIYVFRKIVLGQVVRRTDKLDDRIKSAPSISLREFSRHAIGLEIQASAFTRLVQRGVDLYIA